MVTTLLYSRVTLFRFTLVGKMRDVVKGGGGVGLIEMYDGYGSDMGETRKTREGVGDGNQ